MRIVIVFAGGRDGYQVPIALRRAGHDVMLVTDYIPGRFLRRIGKLFPSWRPARRALERSKDIEGITVVTPPLALGLFFLSRLFGGVSFPLSATVLGRSAGRLAVGGGRSIDVLLAYSTYAHAAFPVAQASGVKCVLFQMHPHARTCVNILERLSNIKRGKDRSIEWEFRISERHYVKLCNEWRMADVIIAASTFTKRSLTDEGAKSENIHVVPYGVSANSAQGRISSVRDQAATKPRALFTGSLVRRKGLLTLAKVATELAAEWEFIVVGRGQYEEEVLQALRACRNVSIKIDVSYMELTRLREEVDIFFFPSFLEGFGLVILESMERGLPVLTTEATCGPDVLRPEVDGIYVAPGDSRAMVDALRRLGTNREKLNEMRASCSARALEFTWERFRQGVVRVVEDCKPL